MGYSNLYLFTKDVLKDGGSFSFENFEAFRKQLDLINETLIYSISWLAKTKHYK